MLVVRRGQSQIKFLMKVVTGLLVEDLLALVIEPDPAVVVIERPAGLGLGQRCRTRQCPGLVLSSSG